MGEEMRGGERRETVVLCKMNENCLIKKNRIKNNGKEGSREMVTNPKNF